MNRTDAKAIVRTVLGISTSFTAARIISPLFVSANPIGIVAGAIGTIVLSSAASNAAVEDAMTLIDEVFPDKN